MRKVEHYICEVCGTEYKEKGMCDECEKAHKVDLTIAKARYVSIAQNATGLPISIEVEYKDGKETKRATYKR